MAAIPDTSSATSHYNNFDAIRIVAAFMVLYSHQFALTGRPEPSFLGMHSWGGLAVIIFFVVSGFLVTSSWYNDPNALRFGVRRILRLWPALTTVVVLTAYGLGAWVTSLPLGEYWKHQATLDYLHILRMQIYYVLPGVFEHNPYAFGVNGSLWTIPLEVRCYVVLAVAGLLQLLRWRTVWLGCIALYMVWFITKSSADITGHVHYGRELSAFFLAGSALFLLKEHWERRPVAWLLAVSGLGALLWLAGWHYTATLAALPLLILYAGTRSTPIVRRFGRWGDPSYGAYLLAFPTQQTVIHFLYPQFGFASTLAMASAITFALAYASWHFIEKPALRLKPRRKRGIRGTTPPSGTRKWWQWRRLAGAGKETHTPLLFALFFCVLALTSQTAYLYQSGASFTELLVGTLPTLGATMLVCAATTALGSVHPRGLRSLCQALFIGLVFVATVMTLIAAIGYWQTGSIPRLQQLDGLTWDIVGRSITALADSHGAWLAAAMATAITLLILLHALLAHIKHLRCPPAVIWLTGAALLAVGVFTNSQDAMANAPFIGARLLHVDIDPESTLTEPARHAENQFFRRYHDELKEITQTPRYPEIFQAIRNTNIIWVVMESVRAKDVPLYGGSAEMPNFMKAKEHMLVLDHLYVQDPRSTKSYTQMDLGKFSLLSWSTYSNNVPWLFPNDGLANHLDRLGYSTISLINSDANYDNNQLFQDRHGYQKTMYRQALNPGSRSADDLRLLEQAKEEIASAKSPFYMMLWPVETHHPYGREYWAQEGSGQEKTPAKTNHFGKEDLARYLRALNQADDWFGRLLAILESQGMDERTTIIVTGDHGQAFGEHEPGNVFHGNGVYEESVHIPGFIYNKKIKGLHRDERYMRLLDIPATILHTASENTYIFNDGRSLFKDYKNEMPIYLFNSWGGAIGIIHDGQKLWWRTNAPGHLFGASTKEIQVDPAKERQPASDSQTSRLLKPLDEWEAAMTTRTARLLTLKDTRQPPIEDIFRVYCDDGNGFREEKKNYTQFAGLSGKISIDINQNCHALRIAPIHNTILPHGTQLQMTFKNPRIISDGRIMEFGAFEPINSNDIKIIDSHEFLITGNHPFMDYKLPPKEQNISTFSTYIKYTWAQR